MADELPLNDNARLPEQDRRAGVIMVAEGLRC